MAFFLLAPVAVVIYESLTPSALVNATGLSLANYVHYFGTFFYYDAILETLKLAVSATVLSVLIGYGASLVLRRVTHIFGSTAVLLLAFPIMAGPMATVMGWMVLMTSDGAASQVARFILQLLGFGNGQVILLGSDPAVIIGMVQFNLPFVILNILPVLLGIDPTLESAATDLGAGRWSTFWHVTRPLSMQGVYSAALISFALSLSSYLSPLFLGNRSRQVLTTQIGLLMQTPGTLQFAATASVVLLAMSAVVLVLYVVGLARSFRGMDLL